MFVMDVEKKILVFSENEVVVKSLKIFYEKLNLSSDAKVITTCCAENTASRGLHVNHINLALSRHDIDEPSQDITWYLYPANCT